MLQGLQSIGNFCRRSGSRWVSCTRMMLLIIFKSELPILYWDCPQIIWVVGQLGCPSGSNLLPPWKTLLGSC